MAKTQHNVSTGNGRSFRRALRTNTGAIDLASIMVGVIVIGVIAGTIAATVFAVIPWSQNAAAQQALDAVRTAEAVAQVQDSRFSNWAGLRSTDRIQSSDTTNVATDESGSCYVAVSASATGTVYYVTDSDPTPQKVTSGLTALCVTDIEFAALVSDVSGPDGTLTTPASLTNVSAGETFTVAQDAAGKLWAWGSNNVGQLGNGTLTNSSTPVAVNVSALGAARIVSVSVGTYHTVALDSNGKVWTWGGGSGGQMGDGAVDNDLTPIAVTAGTFGDATVTSVKAGYYYSVAQDDTGKMWAWGANESGQLGDGSIVNRSVPVAVITSALGEATVTGFAAGVRHTLAADSTGRLWAWGYNANGQLGDGTKINRSSPVPVNTTALNGATFAGPIAAGYYHTVAQDSTGKLWAWGSNSDGQLGDGTTIAKLTPVKVDTAALGAATVSTFSSGGHHVIAKDSLGHLWAWGDNANGQLGIGSTTDRTSPVPVLFDAAVPAIDVVSSGYVHTVARDVDGKLWAWGNNSLGKLGDGTTVSRTLPTAVSGW